MATLAEIQAQHPEWNVVDVVDAPGGGQLAVGADGGVFALSGARFGDNYGGSYQGYLNQTGRTGTEAMTFGAGSLRADAGGYSLTSTTGANYRFDYNQAAAAPAPTQTQTPAEQRAASPEGTSAKGLLAATLASFGLPASLADRLWTEEYVNKGTPITAITDLVLPETQEYKARFPGLAELRERRNRGENVLIPTPAEYIQLEVGIAGVMRDAGLPPGAFDEPSELAKFIGGSVSPKEVEDRIGAAKQLLYNSPVETREELNRLYGLDEGEAIAYILNPEVGMREVQKRVLAGGIAGTSSRVGFGLLTAAEAEQLAESGVTNPQAEQRFGELTAIGEGLFAETIEERQAGEDLGRQTQIGFAAGSAAAEAQMQRRRRSRSAQFEGGGGAATGGRGSTGLG